MSIWPNHTPYVWIPSCGMSKIQLGMECIPRLTKQKLRLLDKRKVKTMPVVCYQPHIYKNAIPGSPLYKYGETYALHTMGALIWHLLFHNLPAFCFLQMRWRMISITERDSRYKSIHITIEHVWISPNDTHMYGSLRVEWVKSVSYTHLTLPTNREV